MERPASPLEVTTATREAAGEAQMRRERSEAKLRQCFGASVGSGRRSEVVEMAEAGVLEDGTETRARGELPGRTSPLGAGWSPPLWRLRPARCERAVAAA